MLTKVLKKAVAGTGVLTSKVEGPRVPSIKIDCAFALRELNRKGAMSRMVLDREAVTSYERDSYQVLKLICDYQYGCTEVLSTLKEHFIDASHRQTPCTGI